MKNPVLAAFIALSLPSAHAGQAYLTDPSRVKCDATHSIWGDEAESTVEVGGKRVFFRSQAESHAEINADYDRCLTTVGLASALDKKILVRPGASTMADALTVDKLGTSYDLEISRLRCDHHWTRFSERAAVLYDEKPIYAFTYRTGTSYDDADETYQNCRTFLESARLQGHKTIRFNPTYFYENDLSSLLVVFSVD